MEVVVEVGGWEHECCGRSFERNQVVDVRCIRYTGEDGVMHLVESHHSLRRGTRVQGRVTDIRLVQYGRAAKSVLRLPSGLALRGFDDVDDGHLEDPRTGDPVAADSREFLVTIRTSPGA